MPKDLDFKEVCRFVRADGGTLIDAADKLETAALLVSPFFLGPGSLPAALSMLTVKDRLASLGKTILDKVAARKESDYLARMRRMEIAYGLICYTAFFEALDQTLSKDLRKQIDLGPEVWKHFEEAATPIPREDDAASVGPDLPAADGPLVRPLPFPHPVGCFQDVTRALGKMYDQMAKAFLELVEKLVLAGETDEKTDAEIRRSLKGLSKAAVRCFEAQYFELARQYDEFWLWAQLQNQKETGIRVRDLSVLLKEHRTLALQAEKRLDVGFVRLQKAIQAIPDTFGEIEAAKVVEGLRRRYTSRIEEPVIEDKEVAEGTEHALVFPKISEAFIPQSYRVLRQTRDGIHLENEGTWESVERRSDLAAFIISYLSSPYSIETPLLILGHPGSGKSLLTKVLSARLMSEACTPVRIPLREVNADLGIEALVERQIEKDAEIRIDSWADFANQFRDRPLLVILDGYDELLQASGTVFRGYLDQVQKFQQSQIVHEHPVRVIVTSRITLIDKATVPDGTTVVRLLEFSEEQRDTWIKIWNQSNAAYFQSREPKVKPFSLPKGEEGGRHNKILELAEQPLLLLMLALYDSEDNSLGEKTQLDRTILYNSLLRRFVRRERRRYVEEFDHLPPGEQGQEIDKEMKRLGVAAIGMYNRRKLHILSSELSKDIAFFELERGIEVERGRPMTQADFLLGSFFFIHQSSSGEGEEPHSGGDTAFEFLHNTFGEFLTADFILRFAFQETEALQELKQNKSLRGELQRKLEDPNGLAKEWFACLMYAPLFSRPVIPEMLREWASHLLAKHQRSREDFLRSLDEILKSQVAMLLDSRAFPEIMRGEAAIQFAEVPFLGLLATYTLNLMILRTILDNGDFVFDEREYGASATEFGPDDTETRPWDQLALIWRSWLRIETLSGLAAILAATREGSKVTLKRREDFRGRSASDGLEHVVNVGIALADNISVGLAGLHSRAVEEGEFPGLDQLEERLRSEGIDLSLEFILRRLRAWLAHPGGPTEEGDQLATAGLREVITKRQRTDSARAFFDLLRMAIRRGSISFRCERQLRSELFHPGRYAEIIGASPELAVGLLQLMREFRGDLRNERFGEEFFERFMHPGHVMEMADMRPEVAVEWLRLVREFGGHRWMERFGDEFFERFMHRGHVMEMADMRPEVAVEWLRLVREFGGHQWAQRFGDEFFERFMHPRHARDVADMRPEVAVEWLRLVREFGGHRWMERFGDEFFERFMHPRHARDVADMRPEVAVEWLRLVREFGGHQWAERFGDEFFERFMHRGHVREMADMRPEVAVEWLRLVREFGGHQWAQRFGDEFFERFMHSRHARDVADMRPEVAVEWLRLVREFGGHQWAERFGDEFFERFMPSRHARDVADMRPEVAVEWLRLVREFGGHQWAGRFGDEFFERFMHPRRLIGMLGAQPAVALEWLRFAEGVGNTDWQLRLAQNLLQELESHEVARMIHGPQEGALALIKAMFPSAGRELGSPPPAELSGVLNSLPPRRFDLRRVPLDCLRALRTYAFLTEDVELLERVDEHVGWELPAG